MKSGFKKILGVVMIICVFWYMIDYIDVKLEGINSKESKVDLNDKDKLVQGNNIDVSTELVLVNREYGLSKDYKPEALTIPNIPFADGAEHEEKHVAGIIIKPIEELVNTAKEEGIILLGNSAYRSYKSQKDIYSDRVKSEGKELADAYVAKPGFSEHQTGLCIDITNEDRYFMKGTKEADWLGENCL